MSGNMVIKRDECIIMKLQGCGWDCILNHLEGISNLFNVGIQRIDI